MPPPNSMLIVFNRFGVGALLFSFVPVIGLIFTFTNTVGAALWAAQLGAQSNIIEGTPGTEESVKDK